MPTNPTLIDLANQISSSATAVTEFLKNAGLPEPSFAADGPANFPNDPALQSARLSLIEAAMSLYHLAAGPDDYLRWQSVTLKHDQMVLDFLTKFNVWSAVPPDGSISCADLATKVDVPESILRRVLRHAMTLRIFTCPSSDPNSDLVAHTATSALPARNPLIASMIGINTDELASAMLKQAEAIKIWGESPEPSETAVMIALGRGKYRTFWEFLEEDGEGERKGWRAKRFAEAMRSWTYKGSHLISHIHTGFDWESLDEAIVVDVGGSAGHISFELASKHPKLKCIVQDLPVLESQFHAAIPTELKDRVTFQAHDFFAPQPVKHADAYFLKHVLHDWADPYSVKIIQALVSAMKDGSRIILMDYVMPPRGALPLTLERVITGLDLTMMGLLNSKERSREEWIELFSKVDKRLEVKAFRQPPGSAATLIEVVFHETQTP